MLLAALLVAAGINSGTANAQELDCAAIENRPQCESVAECLWGAQPKPHCFWRSFSDARVETLQERYIELFQAFSGCDSFPSMDAIERAFTKEFRLLFPAASQNEVDAVVATSLGVVAAASLIGDVDIFSPDFLATPPPKLSKEACERLRAEHRDLFNE